MMNPKINIPYIKLLVPLLVVCIATLILTSSNTLIAQNNDDMDKFAMEIVNNMSTEEKVGQLVMVSWSFDYLTESLKELLDDYHVGAVYITGRNSVSATQAARITNELQVFVWESNQKMREEEPYFLPLFLAADHEGDGPRLTRIRQGMTDVPSPLGIGATWKPEHSETVGEIVGKELRAIGINMLLGPVLDVVDDPDKNVSGNLDVRVFGGDPFWVGEMGKAYIQGIHSGSMGQVLTVAKHFPGHGDSTRSVDCCIAETDKSDEELFSIDLIPFIEVTKNVNYDSNSATDAIMSSHIGIQATDNKPISLFYENEQGGLVRILELEEFREWYADGFVVSDNLGVEAISSRYWSSPPDLIALNALKAGNDLLILHDFFIATSSSDYLTRDANSHKNVKLVLERLIQEYENDQYVRERIDNAVRKIVKSKLRMYPQLSIDTVTVDRSDVSRLAGLEEYKELVSEIAKDAIALIKPSTIEELPSKPQFHDRFLFILHDIEVPGCPLCGPTWRDGTKNTITNVLGDLGYNNIGWLNYYRKDEKTGLDGFSQFLHWNNSNKTESEFELSQEANDNILSELSSADWIVFLTIAGDCGPYAWDTSLPTYERCRAGFRNEGDVLHEFQEFKHKYPTHANIVAISFGAPPWALDTTDVSGINIYYGAFNQLEPFVLYAARALLQEDRPRGASPIDVKGTPYNLIDVLSPAPGQEIDIKVLNEPLGTIWALGETIEIGISSIVDHNGNPVQYFPRVNWSGKYSDDYIVEPNLTGTDTVLIDGQAHAKFRLDRAGQVSFSANLGDLGSNLLTIEVPEQRSPEVASPTGEITASPVNTTEPAPVENTELAQLEEPEPAPLDETEPTPMDEVTPAPVNETKAPPTLKEIPFSQLILVFVAGLIILIIINVQKKPVANESKPKSESPVTLIVKEIFSPLAKATAQLEPTFAYGSAVVIALLAVAIAGVILPDGIVWFIAFITLVILAAFVFSDRDTRLNTKKSIGTKVIPIMNIVDKDGAKVFKSYVNNKDTKSNLHGKLFEVLCEYFNAEELNTLCFKLNIEYDNLSGKERDVKARELIKYVERRNDLDKLVVLIRQERGDVI